MTAYRGMRGNIWPKHR